MTKGVPPQAGSGLRPFGVEPQDASQAEPLVPNATRADVLAELRRRDPARYDKCVNLSFTPGPNWNGSAAQIADAMQAVDRELANPYRNMASRLGGEAMFLRDEAHQQFDYADGYPGKPIPLTSQQKAAARLVPIIEEACKLLREAASVIEAAAAGETTKIGSTEGESAVGSEASETPSPSPSPAAGR